MILAFSSMLIIIPIVKPIQHPFRVTPMQLKINMKKLEVVLFMPKNQKVKMPIIVGYAS